MKTIIIILLKLSKSKNEKYCWKFFGRYIFIFEIFINFYSRDWNCKELKYEKQGKNVKN